MFAASLNLTIEPVRPVNDHRPPPRGLRALVARSLAWALIASLLLHFAAILLPGWALPALGDLLGPRATILDAQLAPARPPPAPATRPARPHPHRAAPDRMAMLANSAVVPDSVSVPAEMPLPPADNGDEDALLATVPDVAPVLPKSGHIRFSVLRGDGGFEIGQATHEWHHDGKTYSMTATTQTTGIAALIHPARTVQTSTGTIVWGDLLPGDFRNDRGGGDVQTAHFDWDKLEVTLNGRDQVSIAGGAEDLLSMFYQLTQAARRGAGFQMAVATGRKVERYVFEWLDEEDVTVNAGHFRCWHVRVRAASGGDDITEVWLGQSVAGLPVKIRHADHKGGVYDQLAEEIDYEGKP